MSGVMKVARGRLASAVIVLAFTSALAVARQSVQEFRVDAASTAVTVRVGRAGLLSFAGHEHEIAVPAIAGRISLTPDVTRSQVSLQMDAKAMKVTGRGEPAGDVAEVQETMLSDRVLDVQRYPTITLESDRIALRQRSADGFGLSVDGRLTLHGVSRPISVPVTVRLSGNRMTASGTVTIRQSDFGIRPITAGGGTVKVKDEVTVAFTIVAVG